MTMFIIHSNSKQIFYCFALGHTLYHTGYKKKLITSLERQNPLHQNVSYLDYSLLSTSETKGCLRQKGENYNENTKGYITIITEIACLQGLVYTTDKKPVRWFVISMHFSPFRQKQPFVLSAVLHKNYYSLAGILEG